ncbi:hypothetical protein EYC80_010304 [Monilinia laxa]|uniref:BTB domain-containing protein n=1 Tax=Monilinia laxa TaxID=61186 RepID=A0A5N6JRD7_MONLA|nr:hypothetical protein EYC80_010304 [Monilinia laxa]
MLNFGSKGNKPSTNTKIPASVKLLQEKLEAYKISEEASPSGFLIPTPEQLPPDIKNPTSDDLFIMVGIAGTPMYIHRDILQNKVTQGYFEQVFGKRAQELSPFGGPCATLLWDDWYTVRMFLSWTLCLSLTSTDKFVYKEKFCTMEERSDLLDKVLNLNIFAEKYRITKLQDDSLALLIQICKEERCPLQVYHVKKCCDYTNKHAKVRQFLVQFTLWIMRDRTRAELHKRDWEMSEIIMAHSDGNNDSQLEIDLKALIFNPRNGPDWEATDPRRAPPCEFHQHGIHNICPYGEVDGFQIVDDQQSRNTPAGSVTVNKQQRSGNKRLQWGFDLVPEILRPVSLLSYEEEAEEWEKWDYEE